MQVTIAVPYMHSELASVPLSAEVLLFDPGLAGDAPGRFRPDTLPLQPSEARSALADLLDFARQFKDPKDLAYMATGAAQTRFDSAHLREGELQDLKQFAGSGAATPAPTPEPESPDPLVAVQRSLLLLWSLEEQALELLSLDQRMTDSWKKFDSAISGEAVEGGDEDDAETSAAGLSRHSSPLTPLGADAAIQAAPAAAVVEQMLAFVPAGSRLFAADGDVVALWREAGVEEGAETPGWKLAGKPGPQPEKPWLQDMYTAAGLTAAGTGEEGA